MLMMVAILARHDGELSAPLILQHLHPGLQAINGAKRLTVAAAVRLQVQLQFKSQLRVLISRLVDTNLYRVWFANVISVPFYDDEPQ